MAIQIKFYNIIIPISNLSKSKKLIDLDNFLNYYLKKGKLKSIWHDDQLITIGGIMSPADVEQEIDILTKLGLNPFKKILGNKYWDDLCVVDFIEGPTLPCSWLTIHNDPHGISYAWLKNKEIGVIIGPDIKK
jgi:hypothetical protein